MVGHQQIELMIGPRVEETLVPMAIELIADLRAIELDVFVRRETRRDELEDVLLLDGCKIERDRLGCSDDPPTIERRRSEQGTDTHVLVEVDATDLEPDRIARIRAADSDELGSPGPRTVAGRRGRELLILVAGEEGSLAFGQPRPGLQRKVQGDDILAQLDISSRLPIELG